MGVRSYGMYLLHMLAHWATWEWLLADIEAWSRYPKLGVRLVCFFGLTLALVALSYRLFERPFLELKKSFRAVRASDERMLATSSPRAVPELVSVEEGGIQAA